MTDTHAPRPEAPERIYRIKPSGSSAVLYSSRRRFPGSPDEVEYIRADALRPAASEGDVDGGLRHGMNCPANSLAPWESDPCNCGLEWRIALETEKTMHAAWRKRAEEAESQLSAAPKPPQSQSLAEENERLRNAITDAVAQLYAVNNVQQAPFLKGAIGAALQILNGARE